MRIPTFAFAAAAAFALRAADTPVNLFPVDRFTPVMMHGRVSAARGWGMQDLPRYDWIFGKKEYISGEECFELECKDGVFTFAFPDPLHPAYRNSKRPIRFAPAAGFPPPPAPKYRTTGRIRFDRGSLSLNNGIKLDPSPEWHSVDRTTPAPMREINFSPAAGGSYSFADLRCVPVYPKLGGEIALPGGGKLTRFLLPRNASFLVRRGIALWRGWLWKLTGVALPIETVDTVKPAPGAFAAVKGETAPGGWKLDVNARGITLVYGDELAIEPALFDYLRLELGCNFYHHTFRKLPPDGSVKQLPAIRREAKPKFRIYTGDGGVMAELGGVYRDLFYTFNIADYYHLHGPISDHILNVVLPRELYYKNHPEYFMMNSAGKRVVKYNPFQINPCLSNPEARKIIVRNAVEYAKAQTSSTFLDVNLADDFALCRCPGCAELNDGLTNDSEGASLLANEIAEAVAGEVPGMVFNRSAYATRQAPPKKIRKVADNVILNYCAGHGPLPCTLHLDCEINRKGYAEIREWGKLFDKSKIGFMTYRDVRPIHHLKFLERLNQDGTYSIYTFIWKGFSPATWFVTARWNLGEDPVKLVEVS